MTVHSRNFRQLIFCPHRKSQLLLERPQQKCNELLPSWSASSAALKIKTHGRLGLKAALISRAGVSVLSSAWISGHCSFVAACHNHWEMMIQAAQMLPLMLRDAWPCYHQWTSCLYKAVFSLCIGQLSPKRAWAKVHESTRVKRVNGFWRHLEIFFPLYLSLSCVRGSFAQRRANTEGRGSNGHEPMQRTALAGLCWSAVLTTPVKEAVTWDVHYSAPPWGCLEKPFWQCHTNTGKDTYIQTFWEKRKSGRKSAIKRLSL